MKRPETFYGHEIDNSCILMTAIHLAPDRDVKADTLYPVGKGWAFADRDTKAGERGRFFIAGNFRLDCADGHIFQVGERAAFDPVAMKVIPKNTPGAIFDIDIAVYVPREGDTPPFAMAYVAQEEVL